MLRGEGEAGSQTGPGCAALGRSLSPGPCGLVMGVQRTVCSISSSGLSALPAPEALRNKSFLGKGSLVVAASRGRGKNPRGAQATRGSKSLERGGPQLPGPSAHAHSPYLLESRKGTSTNPPFLGHLLLLTENTWKGL